MLAIVYVLETPRTMHTFGYLWLRFIVVKAYTTEPTRQRQQSLDKSTHRPPKPSPSSEETHKCSLLQHNKIQYSVHNVSALGRDSAPKVLIVAGHVGTLWPATIIPPNSKKESRRPA